MRFKTTWIYPVLVLMPGISCTKTKTEASGSKVTAALKPVVVTDSVAHDSDDPAIWINKHNPSKSLVLGTDKMEITGSLYVFDLEGHIKPDLVIDSLDRPNNVAVAYNVPAGNDTLDIAVVTERRNGQIRLFSLPDMQAVDDGGIPVFTNQPAYNLVMGIGVYQPASKEKIT